jgi:Flp pilus assembly protein TadD
MPQYLATGNGLEMWFTLGKADGTAFDAGTYELSISFADVRRFLKSANGLPWEGEMKIFDRRRIVVREPRSKEEQTTFWRIEGNDRLGKHQALEAIQFLEPLAQALPTDWQAQGALGEALRQTKQYDRAAVAFERALPGWLASRERRGDLITNSLAGVYLVLGRDSEAVRVLRAAGIRETEIPTRLDLLRRIQQ